MAVRAKLRRIKVPHRPFDLTVTWFRRRLFAACTLLASALLLSCSGPKRTPSGLDEPNAPVAPANAGQRLWQIPLHWNSTLDGRAVASDGYLSYDVEFVPRAKWSDDPYLNVTGGHDTSVSGKPLIALELRRAWTTGDFKRWLNSGSVEEIAEGEPFPASFAIQVPKGFRPEGLRLALLRQIARVCAGEVSFLELQCTPFLPMKINVQDETGMAVSGCKVSLFPLTNFEEGDDSDSWLAQANQVKPEWNFHTRMLARAWAEATRLSSVTIETAEPGTVSFNVVPHDVELPVPRPAKLAGETDVSGTLELASLAPGRYLFAAAKPGFGYSVQELDSRGVRAQIMTVRAIPNGSATIKVLWPGEGERRLDCVLSPGMQSYVNEDNAIVELNVAAHGANETELRVTGLPIGPWRICNDRSWDWYAPVLHLKERAPASVTLNLRDPQMATWRIRAFVGDEELREFRFNYFADTGGNAGVHSVQKDSNRDESSVELQAGHYRARLGEKEWEFDIKPGEERVDEIRIPVRDVTVELDKSTVACFDAEKPLHLFVRAEMPHDDVFDGYLKALAGDVHGSRPMAVFAPGGLAQFRLPAGGYRLRVSGLATTDFRYSPRDDLSFEVGMDLRGSGPVSIKLDPAAYPEVTPFDLELRGGEPGEQWFISSRSTRSTLLDPLDIDDDGRTDKAEFPHHIYVDWVAGTPLKRRFLGLPRDFSIYCSAIARPCEFALHLPITSRSGMVVDFDQINAFPRIEFRRHPDRVPGLSTYARFECADGVTGWAQIYPYDPDKWETPRVPVSHGRVRIWFSRLDRYGHVRGIHRIELDVGKEGAVIDLDTIDRANFSLTELKVVLQGMPMDRALRDRMWFMRGDVEWASRAGYVFIGHCIEIELIEEGVPEARRPRFFLGYCRSEFHPELHKVYAVRLPPGRYRVIPWRGAREADCRVVEVKSGEAAKVEVRTD
jgi:hypothetical protein